jgi:hypothetical protein
MASECSGEGAWQQARARAPAEREDAGAKRAEAGGEGGGG